MFRKENTQTQGAAGAANLEQVIVDKPKLINLMSTNQEAALKIIRNDPSVASLFITAMLCDHKVPKESSQSVPKLRIAIYGNSEATLVSTRNSEVESEWRKNDIPAKSQFVAADLSRKQIRQVIASPLLAQCLQAEPVYALESLVKLLRADADNKKRTGERIESAELEPLFVSALRVQSNSVTKCLNGMTEALITLHNGIIEQRLKWQRYESTHEDLVNVRGHERDSDWSKRLDSTEVGIKFSRLKFDELVPEYFTLRMLGRVLIRAAFKGLQVDDGFTHALESLEPQDRGALNTLNQFSLKETMTWARIESPSTFIQCAQSLMRLEERLRT
jgi:hypothetical protein